MEDNNMEDDNMEDISPRSKLLIFITFFGIFLLCPMSLRCPWKYIGGPSCSATENKYCRETNQVDETGRNIFNCKVFGLSIE